MGVKIMSGIHDDIVCVASEDHNAHRLSCILHTFQVV